MIIIEEKEQLTKTVKETIKDEYKHIKNPSKI